MTQRYIFNTSGDYVAFISNHNLFNVNLDWLGVVRNGNEVYDPKGKYFGNILSDDRIAKSILTHVMSTILPPLQPLRPLRPLTPLRRLRMIPLPYPYVDVFEKQADLSKVDFEKLVGSKLVAEDGKFLGNISFDRFDPNSLSNELGPYGSPYSSDSIFNQYSTYGSIYSALSPFNIYSATGPKVVKNGKVLGMLTLNPYVFNKIDAIEFMDWWKSRN